MDTPESGYCKVCINNEFQVLWHNEKYCIKCLLIKTDEYRQQNQKEGFVKDVEILFIQPAEERRSIFFS